MTTSKIDPKTLNAIEWRCIGPPRGGRVVAVAGDPVNPAVFYFGACAGGVWKTDDAGTYWQNISDGFFETASVGALAVSDSDPSVIYAGMGESCIRLDVTHGDGVYRTTDGGKTWQNVGLKDTRHISRVRIHPTNPDIVFVAALGHAFGPNEERGIYRSTNGGNSWDKVLYVDQDTGMADLSLDPSNPRILYASAWEARRNFWSMSSGGDESGVYRSTDGGDTWTNISKNPGLPSGLLGRIGVAACPAKAGRVWATVESADEPGVYRSEDFGDTWELVSDNRDLQGRPWYYQHIFADPQNADTVWVLNYQAYKSIDGGKTFSQVTTPHGDNHDLWIDPRNPQRMVEGNDGGACVSLNGGDTWSTIYNQMTSQFYHVTTDTQFPYRVYGTQQDNSAISVPSRTHKGAIPWGDCYAVGSSESGYIVVDPNDPNVVISGAIGSSPGGGGNMLRYDHSTGQVRIITVWPELYTGWGAKDMKYRFQWTYPITFSPHDSNVLYATGNIVFRSNDQGSSWERMSPDLTRNDTSKMGPSGGPVTKDTSAAEIYGTIFAFVESTHEKGVFWAGSDDGLLHVSRNNGITWENVTPKSGSGLMSLFGDTGLPEWTMVSMIEASPHDAATAYVAATRYKLDDNRPILLKTNDYGQSWTDISDGIPKDDFTRAIREDPKRKGMLYVGTETNAYLSYDDGESWKSMRGNMPVVPVYDIIVKEDDLIAATHGRSFWIMDDLTQLRQIDEHVEQKPFHLMRPRDTIRLPAPFRGRRPSEGKNYQLSLGAAVTYTEEKGPDGSAVRKFLDAGQNPPSGIIVTYHLREQSDDALTLSFHDSDGHVVKSFSSSKPESEEQNGDPLAPANAGMNRFIWNMRYEFANKVPGDKTTADRVTGPLSPPGTYEVRLTIGEQSQSQQFEIIKDPRVEATNDDLQAQFDLFISIRDKLSEMHDSINKLRSVKSQAEEWSKRAASTSAAERVSEAAEGLSTKLSAIENELVQVEYQGARDRLHLPTKLNAKLAELLSVVGAADFAPTQQSYDVFDDLKTRIDPQLSELQTIFDTDVSEFENIVHELEIPAIVPRTTP